VLRFRLMVKNEVRICGLKHQKEKRSMDHFAGQGDERLRASAWTH
jgi:hypothetical protein